VPHSELSTMRAPIRLQYGFDALLLQCKAYDVLDSVIAVVDSTGALRYANPAFARLNASLRDSPENHARHASLFECPEVLAWLRAALQTMRSEPLHQTFFYSPRIQVKLNCKPPQLSTTRN
jgi:hypothetical protein